MKDIFQRQLAIYPHPRQRKQQIWCNRCRTLVVVYRLTMTTLNRFQVHDKDNTMGIPTTSISAFNYERNQLIYVAIQAFLQLLHNFITMFPFSESERTVSIHYLRLLHAPGAPELYPLAESESIVPFRHRQQLGDIVAPEAYPPSMAEPGLHAQRNIGKRWATEGRYGVLQREYF